MIRVEHLSARQGAFKLEDISFEVPEGSWGVVIGPAGSGKTTLLETIAGIVPAARGRVFAAGREVTTAPISARSVGLVYQHAYLFPHLRVGENVAYGAATQTLPSTLLARFGIEALIERRVASLSGGERQLVALVRALAQQPRVLLLDEPFSALDPKRRNATRRLVRDLHREWGITILQVTHDFAEAGLLGDVTVLLDAGRMLQAGPTAEVFQKPASPYVAEFLGAENVLAGTVTGDPVGGGGSRSVVFTCGALAVHAVSDVPDGPAHAVIRGEEVTLSREHQASSARNHFAGTVTDVDPHGPWARVTVDVGGVPIVAMLTNSSVSELGLTNGESIRVAFKAFAVHLC